MDIERQTSNYNERRYGRPWIAKVVITPTKPGGEYQWGEWIGDARNGGEGLLILHNLEPGDIYARGQKDNRQPRNSAPSYYVIQTDGSEAAVGSIVEARKLSVVIKKEIEHAKEIVNDYRICTA